MIQSILVVSRESDYLYAEAPYLAGIFLALSFDAVFLLLHFKFSGNPITSATGAFKGRQAQLVFSHFPFFR